MQDGATYRNCPACGADRCALLDRFSPDPWHVVCCDECDFVYHCNVSVCAAPTEGLVWATTNVARQTILAGLARLGLLARKVGTLAHDRLVPGDGQHAELPMTSNGNEFSTEMHWIGAKCCGFRTPDHVNYFTLQSLRDVAARARFITELVNRTSLLIDGNISVLLRKSKSLQART